MNGTAGSPDPDAGSIAPPSGALLAALPLALLIGGALFVARRRGSTNSAAEQTRAKANSAVAQVKDAVGKARAGRRKPRNLVRYYGIGLLISMIERDTTRRIVLTTLKWMQKRA